MSAPGHLSGRRAGVRKGPVTLRASPRTAAAARQGAPVGEVLRAIVLGIVQGLTEFIPISSSAHLVLVPELLRWPAPSLAFDVALHMGTLVAVSVYFRAEILATARGLLGLDRSAQGLLYRRLGLLIAAGTLPVVVIGLLFEDAIAASFQSPFWSAVQLLANAGILVLGERLRDRRVGVAEAVPARVAAGTGQVPADQPSTDDPADFQSEAPVFGPGGSVRLLPAGEDPADPRGLALSGIRLPAAVAIGVAQVAALLPGISRSGATITAGMGLGLTREAATRFSFLLSLPALLGAGLLSVGDLGGGGSYSGAATAAGVLAAGISGYVAIRFLIALVARTTLIGFARYCVAAGLVGIVGSLLTA